MKGYFYEIKQRTDKVSAKSQEKVRKGKSSTLIWTIMAGAVFLLIAIIFMDVFFFLVVFVLLIVGLSRYNKIDPEIGEIDFKLLGSKNKKKK